MIKYSHQNHLRGGGSLFGLQFPVTIHQRGKLGQDLNQEWPSSCLARFLIEPRPPAQRMTVPMVGWALLHHLITRTSPHRHIHRPVWCRQSFSWDFLFQVTLGYFKITERTNTNELMFWDNPRERWEEARVNQTMRPQRAPNSQYLLDLLRLMDIDVRMSYSSMLRIKKMRQPLHWGIINNGSHKRKTWSSLIHLVCLARKPRDLPVSNPPQY